jgi:ABC-type amino acid transport substrate-binding protein
MRYLFIFSLLAASFVASAQKYQGDSWSKVKSEGKGTLACVFYETPGLIFKDPETGKIQGVCADILKDFATFVKDKYGKDLTIKFVGQEQVFTNFLNESLKSPNVLGVANVSITEDRKKLMAFSPSYMKNPMVLLTHNSAPTLTDLSEISTKFAGFTAETITGSTHVKYISNIKDTYYPELKISYTTGGAIILNQLKTNTRLFTVLDFTEYFDAVKKRLPVKRHNVELGKAEELGFIMAKNSDWEPLWKEFLTKEYTSSIQYRKIIAENLGHAFLTLLN